MVASRPMLRPPERAAGMRAGGRIGAEEAPTLALTGVVAALLVGSLFAGDSFWLGALALLSAAVVAAAALLGVVPLASGRSGFALVGTLLAIATWNGVSVAWSIAPDRSWDELNRVLVYAAFAVLGLALGSLAGTRAARLVAALLTGVVRRHDPLGARGEGDPGALPGRRPRGQAARSDRLLERARARRRRPARARALGRDDRCCRARAPGDRRRGGLRGGGRDPPLRVACRRRCGGRRRPDLALARAFANGASLAGGRRGGARRGGGRLGVHAAGARRGRPGLRGSRRRTEPSSRCSSCSEPPSSSRRSSGSSVWSSVRRRGRGWGRDSPWEPSPPSSPAASSWRREAISSSAAGRSRRGRSGSSTRA